MNEPFDNWNKNYDKFLKFSKAREDGTFKVINKVGFEIYDNDKKIADIWAKGRYKVNVYLSYTSSRNILKSEKIRKAKEIYFKLKNEFQSSLIPF